MDENRYYTTVQGDMWDSIAYQFYGDTKYIGLLFENNQDLLDIFVFSAGTKVYIPELPDEEDEDIKSISLKDIKLGDQLIVDKHLRDFKYTPLKLFEMIRDSEKYRGVDLKLEYSNINDKNYSVKIEAVIISQKLGIKVEGYGNSKEEAGNIEVE